MAKVKSAGSREEPGETKPIKRAICLAGGGPTAGLHIGVLSNLQKKMNFQVWALSCIGAWVGIVYNQFEEGDPARQTYEFFRGLFRDDASFQSFPINTVFGTDWAGNAEAMKNFLFEPDNYKNLFLPRQVMQSLTQAMSLLSRKRKQRTLDEGDINNFIFNHVMALNPAVRFWMALMFKSEIDGLSKLYYPDSRFLKSIKFEKLEGSEKPFIFHNAWNLSRQELELFANKAFVDKSGSETSYKEINAASLCACSALPYIEQTVNIAGESYCEGALVDTVNFKNLLEDHHHPERGDPLDEIWINRIVDADQIRKPANLHDAMANLCQLFAASVGEDDVRLFKYHVREDIAKEDQDRVPEKDRRAFRGTIVEIHVSGDVTYEWSHKNLDAGVRNGRVAAQAAFDEYINSGGERPHGQLRIIGEERREVRKREITAARRAQRQPA